LTAAADIRVADETAIFVSEFVDVGLAPDTGASYSVTWVRRSGAPCAGEQAGRPPTGPHRGMRAHTVTCGDEPVNPVALK